MMRRLFPHFPARFATEPTPAGASAEDTLSRCTPLAQSCPANGAQWWIILSFFFVVALINFFIWFDKGSWKSQFVGGARDHQARTGWGRRQKRTADLGGGPHRSPNPESYKTRLPGGHDQERRDCDRVFAQRRRLEQFKQHKVKALLIFSQFYLRHCVNKQQFHKSLVAMPWWKRNPLGCKSAFLNHMSVLLTCQVRSFFK